MAGKSKSQRSRSPSVNRRRKDPSGGLTEEGRRYFQKKDGAHLRPGVKKVKSVEGMRRKGSFLRRFYGRKKISPLQDRHGKPTRYAKAAYAWGEPVPKNRNDVKRLAMKGAQLLKRYRKERQTQRTRYYGAKENTTLEEETTSGQAKKATVTISKEAGARRCKKGGPALSQLGRQHARRKNER